ncbi:polysaccharide deacetylase family protein [Robertmurraya kyonggiensis]|uniref:Polysaccharide deacetylase family protein n=1 Tax=Robertmurraya kyonggiensis TaxID=1037680 RepID=A0A4U1D8U3_9BACI|nr:polysaccharide deacetylase family protein [Robertmurraya kyonggiensis]TKC18508.1 polysaccharide deacetylase family protein [Robertmurraya kyonggiensis]
MKKILAVLIILLLFGCSNKEELFSKEAEATNVEKVEKSATLLQEEALESVDESLPEDETVVSVQKEPLYRINPTSWAVEPIGDANQKVVLLTIDDAPDKYALEMANTLKFLGVKAIFFVNGHFIDTEEEAKVLKQIHDLGFPIGNHTYSHSHLAELTEKEQYREIVSLNDRVEKIIGERPKFFRAPFGENTDVSRKIAAKEKMVMMNWTYGYDWVPEFQSKDAITEIMVNSPFLHNGANLLMHDRKWTNDALADIVRGFEGKGYQIVDTDLIKTLN